MGVGASALLTLGWVDVLYLSHAGLEVVLGGLKLRGRYQHETPSSRAPRSAMYVRHHGWSLISSACLGWFAWSRGLVDGPDGSMISAVLAIFHGGATFAFVQAWLEGAIPFVKVLLPHLPYALGFLYHAFMA